MTTTFATPSQFLKALEITKTSIVPTLGFYSNHTDHMITCICGRIIASNTLSQAEQQAKLTGRDVYETEIHTCSQCNTSYQMDVEVILDEDDNYVFYIDDTNVCVQRLPHILQDEEGGRMDIHELLVGDSIPLEDGCHRVGMNLYDVHSGILQNVFSANVTTGQLTLF